MSIRRMILAAALMLLPGSVSGQEKDGSLLYVQRGEGLRWYAVDGRTGALTPKGELATPKLSPFYLRVSPDGKTLFAAAVPDRLLAFSIGADGGLTRRAEAPSPGGPCYVDVHPSGRWVATANYGPGKTLVYPVATDGTIGEATTRVSGPQTHSVRFHPEGKLLFSLSVAGRQVVRFAVEGDAAPAPLSMADLGPRHIAFSPRGDFAYVVHERPIRVSSLRVGTTLEPVGTWPALEPGAPEKKELAAAEIAVAPSGRFVYASVRDFSKEGGLNGLAVYAADPESGSLRWIEFVPSGGVSPRGFVIDPSGTFLVVANEIPGTLRTFRIASDTGRLTPSGDPVPVGGTSIGIAWVAR
jgi:6-phosphogluconolactonase